MEFPRPPFKCQAAGNADGHRDAHIATIPAPRVQNLTPSPMHQRIQLFSIPAINLIFFQRSKQPDVVT